MIQITDTLKIIYTIFGVQLSKQFAYLGNSILLKLWSEIKKKKTVKGNSLSSSYSKTLETLPTSPAARSMPPQFYLAPIYPDFQNFLGAGI